MARFGGKANMAKNEHQIIKHKQYISECIIIHDIKEIYSHLHNRNIFQKMYNFSFDEYQIHNSMFLAIKSRAI